VTDALADGGTSIFPKCTKVGRGSWPLDPPAVAGAFAYAQTTIPMAALVAKYPYWFQLEVAADGFAGHPSRATINDVVFSNPVTPTGDDSIVALGRDGLWVKKIGFPSEPVGVESGKTTPPGAAIYVKGDVAAQVKPPAEVAVLYCDPAG
jgi:hypothetical protein